MGQSIKKILLIIAFIILGFGLVKVVYPHVTSLHGDSVEKKITIHLSSNSGNPFYVIGKEAKIKVDIAETEEQRIQGLSSTSFMADDEGKLFIFDSPGFYNIWMKDMLFPLDIMWLDKDFRVIEIRKNISPATYPETFTSSAPAKYVLEVNAGVADRYGFMKGDEFDVAE